MFYAVHGVLREREFELYVYIVGIVVLLIYIIIDLIVNDVNRTTLKWVSLSVNYCSTQDMKALSYCNLELFLVISSLIYVGWNSFLIFQTQILCGMKSAKITFSNLNSLHKNKMKISSMLDTPANFWC